ncbi:hypothetical protein L484_016607 [Morus notabilis]|uniref:FLZ-type domain-containing protein n=1 Tax=Morus notabilis TaxID=981085 RepID=W9QL70_9ROSA|nr:uncharacterized protein LOC21399650 [Morus notabilis]EXB39763.1 hypothetical protein L484_016607 [Morus notabilis]
MLLGKRPRLPIKRTTSMTGITVDLTGGEAPEPCDQLAPPPPHHHHNHNFIEAQSQDNNTSFLGYNYQESRSNHNFLQSMLSPRTNTYRRNSTDFVETADFLRTCGLCKRRLASGRDIYIYMGDMAFCSLECREKHIKQAEEKGNSSARISPGDRRQKPASSVAES